MSWLQPLMPMTMPVKVAASAQKRAVRIIFVSFSFRLGPAGRAWKLSSQTRLRPAAARAKKLYSSTPPDQVSPDTASLLASLDLGRHQPDVVDVCGLANIDNIGNVGKVHIVVAPYKHHAFGAIGINVG